MKRQISIVNIDSVTQNGLDHLNSNASLNSAIGLNSNLLSDVDGLDNDVLLRLPGSQPQHALRQNFLEFLM